MGYYKITEKGPQSEAPKNPGANVSHEVQGVLPDADLTMWRGVQATLIDLTEGQVGQIRDALPNLKIERFVPFGFAIETPAEVKN